jgi:hypothetical protein
VLKFEALKKIKLVIFMEFNLGNQFLKMVGR